MSKQSISFSPLPQPNQTEKLPPSEKDREAEMRDREAKLDTLIDLLE